MKRISILPILAPTALVIAGLILVITSEPTAERRNVVIAPNDSLVWPDSAWRRSSYAERGIDSLPILELIDSLSNERFGPIYSLLVVKDGYLITEEYFWGNYSSTVRGAYSITKSFLSALVGIAIERGELPDVTTPIHTLLPQYAEAFKNDSAKKSITVEHLLTMTAGFQWDEWSSALYSQNDYYALISNDMPVALVLDRPLTNAPGQTFTYNSGCSIVLSAILENATGMPVQEYATRHLFEPLGITSATWLTMNELPDGNEVTNGASGLVATSADYARFGLLYARHGRWHGRQVVPLDWYRRSTSSHSLVSPSDADMPFSTFYGYHWWTLRSNIPEIKEYFPQGLLFALGSGMQVIFALPDYDLVVVMTAGQSGEEVWEQTPITSIFYYILRGVIPELYHDEVSEREGAEHESKGG